MNAPANPAAITIRALAPADLEAVVAIDAAAEGRTRRATWRCSASSTRPASRRRSG